MIIAIALAAGIVGLLLLVRANELFLVSVRQGRALLVRGRIPAALLADLRDVLARAGVTRGWVRAVTLEKGAGLTVSSDIDEGTAQRLRNVFATYPLVRLRAAPTQERTLGQLLGLSWLAWMMDRQPR